MRLQGVQLPHSSPLARWWATASLAPRSGERVGERGLLVHVVLALAALTACTSSGLSDQDAVKLVRHYNEQNILAYRTGDARITEPYTGEVEGKRLLGLIGVRLDQKRTLDSQLLEFEVLGVSRRGEEIFVETKERWYWVERRIGTGQPVDLDSTDRYVMRYRIAREKERWVVAETEFVEKPHVGRPWTSWGNDARDLHGVQTKEPGGWDAAIVAVPPHSPLPAERGEGNASAAVLRAPLPSPLPAERGEGRGFSTLSPPGSEGDPQPTFTPSPPRSGGEGRGEGARP
jgi:hypothetical protein